MDKKLIIARYENRENTQRLRMVGSISEKIIDEVFLPHKPYSYCSEENSSYGETSLLVESEDSCPDLVKELNDELKEKNYKDYNIEYRGDISVHPKELSSLKKPQDLYDLVRKTLIRESKGEIKPGDLVKLDYQKALDDINKI